MGLGPLLSQGCPQGAAEPPGPGSCVRISPAAAARWEGVKEKQSDFSTLPFVRGAGKQRKSVPKWTRGHCHRAQGTKMPLRVNTAGRDADLLWDVQGLTHAGYRLIPGLVSRKVVMVCILTHSPWTLQLTREWTAAFGSKNTESCELIPTLEEATWNAKWYRLWKSDHITQQLHSLLGAANYQPHKNLHCDVCRSSIHNGPNLEASKISFSR